MARTSPFMSLLTKCLIFLFLVASDMGLCYDRSNKYRILSVVLSGKGRRLRIKLRGDILEYINDINIQEAVIHILDSNSTEPILNEYTLELSEDIYKFLHKHIEKCLKDEKLKTAIFNSERSIVKEIVKK